MSLRQAYEKNFQATSCFISQYSQVEEGEKNQTRQHFAILTEIIIRCLLVPQHIARLSLPLILRVWRWKTEFIPKASRVGPCVQVFWKFKMSYAWEELLESLSSLWKNWLLSSVRGSRACSYPKPEPEWEPKWEASDLSIRIHFYVTRKISQQPKEAKIWKYMLSQ